MGPWLNPESAQVGPQCVYLSLNGQEARGHELQVPQEARPWNEAARKMCCRVEPPAGLESGRAGGGGCLRLVIGVRTSRRLFTC